MKKYVLRGPAHHQARTILKESGLFKVGQSKHADKAELRAEGKKTWEDMGKNLGIYSYRTADAYRDVWRHCLDYAKAETGCKQILQLTKEHIQSYLQSKIDQQVSLATFRQYSAALGKLETVLNLVSEKYELGQQYEFRNTIREISADATEELQKFEGSRAYVDPDALVSAIDNNDHKFAAQLQAETGLRVYEISQIRSAQIQEVGYLQVRGKGGKLIEKKLPPALYQELVYRTEYGVFKINGDQYRESLKIAAEETGQKYTGSHGLRWSYAQNRMATLTRDSGINYYDALKVVSQEMGHERADITEHYLR